MLIGPHTLLKPSTYGLAGFGIGWAMYLANPNDLFPPVPESLLICAVCVGLFLVSGMAFENIYRTWWAGERLRRMRPHVSGEAPALPLILALAAAGFAGTAKYLIDAIDWFGSVDVLAATLLFSSENVRWAASDLASYGTQLTYFGWIAAALAGYRCGKLRVSLGLTLLIIVILATNVIYIDRTRPTWIVFITGLAFLYGRLERYDIRRLLAGGVGAIAAFLAIFIVVGLWVGKISITADSYESNVLSGPLHNIALYVTGGFGYLNEIVQNERNFNYIPARTLYPFFEFTARLGLSEEPPSRILEFFYLPHPVNVGTFIEPLYRDGGIVYTIVGLVILVFGADWLGIFLLKSQSGLALVAWTNLCFANALAFFTPKFTSFPLWLIVGAGVVAALLKARASTAQVPPLPRIEAPE